MSCRVTRSRLLSAVWVLVLLVVTEHFASSSPLVSPPTSAVVLALCGVFCQQRRLLPTVCTPLSALSCSGGAYRGSCSICRFPSVSTAVALLVSSFFVCPCCLFSSAASLSPSVPFKTCCPHLAAPLVCAPPHSRRIDLLCFYLRCFVYRLFLARSEGDAEFHELMGGFRLVDLCINRCNHCRMATQIWFRQLPDNGSHYPLSLRFWQVRPSLLEAQDL